MKSVYSMLPDQASTVAAEMDAMYLFIFWFSVIGTVAVVVMAIYFAVKYRRLSEDYRPQPPHEHPIVEYVLSAVLLVFMMVMFGWGASLFVRMNRPPADAMEILCVGKQWMWKLEHPTGKREINELHVPLGQPIKLNMTSEDVIHSFFIPAFRVKNDVVPGKHTELWFEAKQLGTFNIFCTEYCGTEHSKMTGFVHVMNPADYQNWLKTASAGGANLPPEEAGKQVFTAKGCLVCHSGLPGALGPKLNGLFGSKVKLLDGTEVEANEDYIRESILNSFAKIKAGYAPVMPLFKGQISEEETMHLIAYIKSLKAEAGTK